MDIFSLSTTTTTTVAAAAAVAALPHPPPPRRLPTSLITQTHRLSTTNNSLSCISFSLKPPPPPPPSPPDPSTASATSKTQSFRRPNALKPAPTPNPAPIPISNTKVPTNPLKDLLKPYKKPLASTSISSKLWLSSKLSPPPPPPPPPPQIEKTHSRKPVEVEDEGAEEEVENSESETPMSEFRQKGKIFVGNLPTWIRKHEVSEFFRQFGPIKSVILIRGHNETERNAGFGFVIYDGDMADRSAVKAVEFDGVEFHGRVLTVKLDDGRRMRAKAEERRRWIDGEEEEEWFRTKWHEERDGSRKAFKRILETQPENWQAVVTAFERIKKPSRREFGLMVGYYARRGDMHRARQTFESMRARGIEPTSHVYTR